MKLRPMATAPRDGTAIIVWWIRDIKFESPFIIKFDTNVGRWKKDGYLGISADELRGWYPPPEVEG